MNIPYILAELQKVGLTQTQIGSELGLKQPTISDMASGKAGVKRPSFQVVSGLGRLAQAHGIQQVDGDATFPPQMTTSK